ncbi:MAG TPA: M1 family aminopeptidase [Candidatus Acidoferrum sp.]|nr:M1 family aminopeptidase [Candidatus Acidoferrum sp.]
MSFRRHFLTPALSLALLTCVAAAPALQAQTPVRPAGFLATHYDISATLDANRQSLSAIAKVDLVANEVTGNVYLQLHPNLLISDVKTADGKTVAFSRDSSNPLEVFVTLPTPVAAGEHVTLTFAYAGLLANEENSPLPGIRAAVIGHDSAFLLLPARWFPLTNYPASRYTATFHLNVPDTFAVAGSGKASAPTPLPGGRLLYTFECSAAGPHGTFVAGNLQLNPKQAEGINVAVYAQRSESDSAQGFADDVARAVTTFSDMFGGLADPDMTVIQLPDGTVRDFSAPGLLLLSHRIWEPKAAERTIARLVASQWFGNSILAASPADVWLTDGLSRYCEELYAEQSAGKEAGLRAVDEFAVGALMYEDAAPIAQSARLVPYTSDYRSVVSNKGAMVFHMLRGMMGDVAFKALLHDFAAKYAGKSARIEDFINLSDQQLQASLKAGDAPPNLRGFFAQWLNSTGVPDFTVDYVTYRTPKGFRIVGKIKQPIDTFSMPVEVRVDTEGNPETKTIDVLGTETPFTIETFGRPKPNGIKIDPNNVILKGSTSLRARAAIARGEELAEVGRYYDAIRQYQRALNIQPGRPLANFRMGEAFFYQKNYQAAANAFRAVAQAVPEPSEKWTEVWGHIYLGKIFDLLGQRERAVNEYSKAKQTNDNTGGAQAEAEKWLKKPYTEGGVSAPAGAPTPAPATSPTKAPAGDKPTLKRPNPNPNPNQ